jgi:hypothetical protein
MKATYGIKTSSKNCCINAKMFKQINNYFFSAFHNNLFYFTLRVTRNYLRVTRNFFTNAVRITRYTVTCIKQCSFAMLCTYFRTAYKLITNTNICKVHMSTYSAFDADNKAVIATSCQQMLLVGCLQKNLISLELRVWYRRKDIKVEKYSGCHCSAGKNHKKSATNGGATPVGRNSLSWGGTWYRADLADTEESGLTMSNDGT